VLLIQPGIAVLVERSLSNLSGRDTDKGIRHESVDSHPVAPEVFPSRPPRIRRNEREVRSQACLPFRA
jgi:hypothetical protein